MVKRFVLLICVLVLLVFSGSVFAQGEPWKFSLSPYLWMPHVKGDASVKGHTAKFNMDFEDIVKMLNFGVMFRAEASKEDISILSDLIFLNLGKKMQIAQPYFGIDASVRGKQLITDLALAYKVKKTQDMSFEVLGGVRHVYLAANLRYEVNPDFPGLPSLAGKWADSEYWFEPMIGGRLKVDFLDKWLFSFRADVSGFGAGSRLTWNVVPEVSYKIKKNVSLNLGYRVLDIDYRHSSGANKFIFNTMLHGPTFGCTIDF